MWVKTTYYCNFCLLLIITKSVYNIVLVQTHTSTEAPTCRMLLPSLILQLLLEGSYNPLALVLVVMFTSMQVPTYRRLQPSLFLQGPCFINFQTGYLWITTPQSEGHVSSNFHNGPINNIGAQNHNCNTTIKYICIN